MDLQDKAIFELPIKNWDKENWDYIDDNYYTQYYFKVENEVNPATHANQGGSHLGLHDYIKPTKNVSYYVWGGRYVHKINFQNQEWQLIDKGSDHVGD